MPHLPPMRPLELTALPLLAFALSCAPPPPTAHIPPPVPTDVASRAPGPPESPPWPSSGWPLQDKLLARATPVLPDPSSFVGLLTTFPSNESPYRLHVGGMEWSVFPPGAPVNPKGYPPPGWQSNPDWPWPLLLGPGQQTPKLSESAHVVRVIVEQDPAMQNDRIRAAEIVVLDQTPEAPFRPSAVLKAFFDPSAGEVGRRAGSLQAALQRALGASHEEDPRLFEPLSPEEEKLLPERWKAGPVYASPRVSWATWEPATRSLRFVYWMGQSSVVERAVPSRDPKAGTFGCDAPPGADCAPEHYPRWTFETRTSRAECALVGTYDPASGGFRIEEYPVTRLPVVVEHHQRSTLGLPMDEGR